MKHNTFILKCFLQFTCTNLDGCQKEGGNFLNLLQKDGVPRIGGGVVPSEKGGFQPWRKLCRKNIAETHYFDSKFMRRPIADVLLKNVDELISSLNKG